MRQAATTHLVDLLGGEAVTIQDVAALPETDLSALLDPLHPAAETEFRPTLVDKTRAIRRPVGLHQAANTHLVDLLGGESSHYPGRGSSTGG